jgi:hypothetical protein
MSNFFRQIPKYQLLPQQNKIVAVRAVKVYGGVEVFLISTLDGVMYLFSLHGFFFPLGRFYSEPVEEVVGCAAERSWHFGENMRLDVPQSASGILEKI